MTETSASPVLTGAIHAVVPARVPRQVRFLETWHAAARRPVPILADALLAAAAGALWPGGAEAGAVVAVTVVVGGLALGLFKPRMILETQGVSWFTRRYVPVALLVFVVADLFAPHTNVNQAWQIALVALGLSTVLRGVLWMLLSRARRQGRCLRRTLVIGAPERVEQVRHRLRTFAECGLEFEGSFSPGASDDSHDPAEGRALVKRLVASHRVEQVLCVVDPDNEAVFRDVIRFASDHVGCGMVLPVPGIGLHQTRGHLGDLPVIPVRMNPSWGSQAAKRVVDIVLASIALLLAGPFMLLVAAAIRLGDPGPAIFKQTRVGRHGHPFKVWKFRSMVVDAEAVRARYLEQNINSGGLLFKLHDDPRVTKVGGFIRRTSIDELPQLINVLKGEMSLVGPRPLPVDPDEFDVSAEIRHRASPGITGLWQVHGGNALCYDDMLDLDITYVTTRSLGLDLVLMARTIPAVLFRRSAY